MLHGQVAVHDDTPSWPVCELDDGKECAREVMIAVSCVRCSCGRLQSGFLVPLPFGLMTMLRTDGSAQGFWWSPTLHTALDNNMGHHHHDYMFTRMHGQAEVVSREHVPDTQILVTRLQQMLHAHHCRPPAQTQNSSESARTCTGARVAVCCQTTASPLYSRNTHMLRSPRAAIPSVRSLLGRGEILNAVVVVQRVVVAANLCAGQQARI